MAEISDVVENKANNSKSFRLDPLYQICNIGSRALPFGFGVLCGLGGMNPNPFSDIFPKDFSMPLKLPWLVYPAAVIASGLGYYYAVLGNPAHAETEDMGILAGWVINSYISFEVGDFIGYAIKNIFHL